MQTNDEPVIHNKSNNPQKNKAKKTSVKIFNKQFNISTLRAVIFALIFGAIGSWVVYKSFAAPTNNDVSEVSIQPSNELLAKRYTMQLVATSRKLQKNPNDKSLLDEAEKIAGERQTAVVGLMQEDADKSVQLEFPSNLTGALPTAAQANVEKQVELQGKLTVTHGESINEKTQELENPFYEYDLTDSTGVSTKLHYKGKELQGLGGSTLKVKGLKLGADMAIASSTDTQVIQTATLAAPAGNKKVAVVLFNFSNNTAQPWTIDQVKASIFGDIGSTNDRYFQEVSFAKYGLAGNQSPDGDVFGWYTISDTNAVCNYGTWSNNAKLAAQAAGVNFTGYDNVMYAFPFTANCTSAGAVWAGLGQNPGSTTWINGYATNPRVTTHELGHNYGVHHANKYVCTDASGIAVIISSSCSSTEYGDPYDVMGRNLRHFNNFHKGRLGYYPSSSSTQTINTSGTYTIAPIEFPTSSVQSLRIPKDYNASGVPISYYYLEARQPSDFDTGLATDKVFTGVSVRFAPDYNVNVQSQLMDMHPGTLDALDTPLAVGETFTDSQRNISVTTQSVDASGATVRVTMSSIACVHANPTVSITPVTQWGNPGDALTYNVQVKNNDGIGCATSAFNLATTLPANISQSPATAQLSLAPGATGTQAIVLTSAASITSGYNSFTVKATNSSVLTSTASSTGNYNINNAADNVAPIVTIASPVDGSAIGNKVSIRATASDNVAVISMEIYINGVRQTSSASGSIFFNWNSRKAPRGTHMITVKAYDSAGNVGQKTISVTN